MPLSTRGGASSVPVKMVRRRTRLDGHDDQLPLRFGAGPLEARVEREAMARQPARRANGVPVRLVARAKIVLLEHRARLRHADADVGIVE